MVLSYVLGRLPLLYSWTCYRFRAPGGIGAGALARTISSKTPLSVYSALVLVAILTLQVARCIFLVYRYDKNSALVLTLRGRARRPAPRPAVRTTHTLPLCPTLVSNHKGNFMEQGRKNPRR